MDDLVLLKDMADRTPLPHAADLAPARARLLAEIAAPVAPRRRRRLVLSGAAVVGLAAAITAVVALGPLEQVGVAPPKASAADVLHQAADAARAMPDVIPRPDQFLYLKAKAGTGEVREVWLSIDGTRDGLIDQNGHKETIPGCVDGREKIIGGNGARPGATQTCEPQPAYLPDAPTDKQGMIAYLRSDLKGEPSDTNFVGKMVMDLVEGTYLRPAARAALFEAFADIDGLVLDEHAKDVAGRPGLGVSWDSNGYSGSMVLDPVRHTYLGSEHEALLVNTIVDKAGQRP